MIIKRQFNSVPFNGVIHQMAQRVSAPERGIVFNRPERYLVKTPFGHLEIGFGDWLVDVDNGSTYVIKSYDIHFFGTRRVSLWQKFKIWLAGL